MNTETSGSAKIPLKPIEKQALYLKISNAIYRYIQVNNLQPGDRLPSEREMSSMLQASRNSIREALRILEDRGLIYVKTGSGVFINDSYGENNSLKIQLTNCTMDEIQELQTVLDHKAVENAMERGTLEEKEKLIAIASEMVKLASANIYSHVLDRSFHDKLYKIGRNNAIEQLISSIRSFRFIQQEDSESGNDSIWLATITQHLTLAQALKDANIELAIQAIDEINDYGFKVLGQKQ